MTQDLSTSDDVRTATPGWLSRGAAAAACHRVDEALTWLGDAIRDAVSGTEANAARAPLALLLLRVGRYADAQRIFDDMLAAAPWRNDVRRARAVFAPFFDRESLHVQRRGAPVVACEGTDAGLVLRVVANGTAASWLVDTGANITAVSESEATRLGLQRDPLPVAAFDLAGGRVLCRTAVIDTLVVSGTVLRHVATLIFPDRLPLSRVAMRPAGILGLPALLALRRVGWSGTVREATGPVPLHGAPCRLAFDGLFLIARGGCSGRPLDLVVDTGNTGPTQLWERFGREWAALVGVHGAAGVRRLTQIGGRRRHDVMILPALPVELGGFQTRLRQVPIFGSSVGDGIHHGSLGSEMLRRAGTSVLLDFEAMLLSIAGDNGGIPELDDIPTTEIALG